MEDALGGMGKGRIGDVVYYYGFLGDGSLFEVLQPTTQNRARLVISAVILLIYSLVRMSLPFPGERHPQLTCLCLTNGKTSII